MFFVFHLNGHLLPVLAAGRVCLDSCVAGEVEHGREETGGRAEPEVFGRIEAKFISAHHTPGQQPGWRGEGHLLPWRPFLAGWAGLHWSWVSRPCGSTGNQSCGPPGESGACPSAHRGPQVGEPLHPLTVCVRLYKDKTGKQYLSDYLYSQF